MEEDRDQAYLQERLPVQASLQAFERFLRISLPILLGADWPNVWVTPPHPIGNMAQFEIMKNEQRLMGGSLGWLSYQMMVLSVWEVGQGALIVELQQRYATQEFYFRVRSLIEKIPPTAEHTTEPPASAQIGKLLPKKRREPSDEAMPHAQGYAYMLEHNCSWQKAFQEFWLPEYEKVIRKKITSVEWPRLRNAFRVAVWRRETGAVRD